MLPSWQGRHGRAGAAFEARTARQHDDGCGEVPCSRHVLLIGRVTVVARGRWTLQPLSESACCVPLHPRHDLLVGVLGVDRCRVAEPLRDDLGGLAGLQTEGRKSMTQIVLVPMSAQAGLCRGPRYADRVVNSLVGGVEIVKLSA